MPTVIYFAGSQGDKPLTLNVEQDPDHVMAARNAAQGQPFPLDTGNGGRVYVQPTTMAFWREPGSRSVASF